MAYREDAPDSTTPPRPAPRRRWSPHVRVALLTVAICPLAGASCGAASGMHGRSEVAEGFFVGLALALAVVLIAGVSRIAQEEGA